MKKLMFLGLALMMAFTLSIPTIFAQQQDTQQAQTSGWQCPGVNQAQGGGWNCPMMKTGAHGKRYCPAIGQGGGMKMGRGCMMRNNQAQPPAQQ
ncbi:MAG: hypothetical protein AAGU11_03515 [Syntrophobacteraceae bacterium]